MPWHADVTPLMALGCAGMFVGVTDKVCAVPVPQAFDGVTVTEPEAAPTVTVMVLVVPPAVCDHPDGKVQV